MWVYLTDLIHMLLSFCSKLKYNHSIPFQCKNRLMQLNLFIFHILLMFYSRTESHISLMCFNEIHVKTYLIKDQYLERHLPIKTSQTLFKLCLLAPLTDFLLNSSSTVSAVYSAVIPPSLMAFFAKI